MSILSVKKFARESFRVAHASRVLVLVSRQNDLSPLGHDFAIRGKVRPDETSAPARETRALPNQNIG